MQRLPLEADFVRLAVLIRIRPRCAVTKLTRMTLLHDVRPMLNFAGQKRVRDRQQENHRGHQIKGLRLNPRPQHFKQSRRCWCRIGIKRQRKIHRGYHKILRSASSE